MILYVSRTCGACGKLLQLLVQMPRVLAATDIRILDGNERAQLEAHELGIRMTPALVVATPDGRRMVYQGPQASQALVAMA